MKKSIIFVSLLLMISVILIISCSQEKLSSESVLTPSSTEKETELDKWVKTNFTDPYNMVLLYKYDDAKVDQNDFVTPASYEKSVQMANIIKYLFLDPYEKHTPKNFLKKYCPKTIILIGSGAFHPNGTVKLGVAENGVQFSLLNVNNLDVNNVDLLYRWYFRTIYHEFSHILHQTTDFSQEFKRISAKNYVRDSWNSEWKNKSSLEAGFISDYSTKDENEDFVELIAHYLTYTPEKWTQTLEKAAGTSGDKPGKKILEQKIALVKDYMQSTWDISMDNLRDEILERAANIDQLDVNSLN